METNNKRPRGLGRGLDALFGDEPVQEEEKSGGTQTLRISDIEPNPHQPRRDFNEEALQTLAESIRDNGLLQPLLVRRNGTGYQLIAGERRWRACRRAGLSEVPAIVMEADDLRMMELALVENLQRENLNPLEEAQSYQVLMDEFGLSQAQAAAKVGKSRPAVANAVRLLTLPENVLDMLRTGELSAGHARALLAVEDDEAISELADRVVKLGLNVRQTERLAALWKDSQEKSPEAPPTQTLESDVDHLTEIRERLSGIWGRRVDFRQNRGKSYVTIEYYDNEDLQALIDALSNHHN